MRRLFPWLLIVLPAPLFAQAKNAAPKDSTPPPPPPRANWLSDRRDLRVGDLLMVVVDEKTSATERAATTAHSNRSQNGSVDAASAPDILKKLGITYQAQSDRGAQADRSGGLTAALTVRVAGIEANGVVRIEGQKFVAIDGRKQEINVTGLVRAEDVGSGNTVSSSRIANATISYKGKSISPSTGIFGKILSILWP